MDRYLLIGGAVALVVFVISLAVTLGGDASLGVGGLLFRVIGAGLTGYVVVLLLRNFGPDG